MRDTVRAIGKLPVLLFLLLAPALAQRLVTGAAPAAAGPDYDVSVGYTYLRMAIPGAGHADLNGLDVSGQIGLSPHWGAIVESSYVRTPDVLDTKHDGYLLGILSGPVFYPLQNRNTRTFVHVLAGSGLIDAAVPVGDTNSRYGWQTRFSYAAGGGVEHAVAGPFAVRLNGDYLRTAFFDSIGLVQPQNNFRVTASLVIRLNRRGSY